MVEAQLDTLALEFTPRAVKTGALANAASLRRWRARSTPQIAGAGGRSRDCVEQWRAADWSKGERAIRKRLIPIAASSRPIFPRLRCWRDIQIDSDAAMREAAKKIIKLGAQAVVIKGGHREDDKLGDGFVLRRAQTSSSSRVCEQRAAARTAPDARSQRRSRRISRAAQSLEDAVRGAKSFVTTALKHSFKLGKGRALLDHFARG